ncbi:MAG: AAA family ATPase, partial [Deltaproteobacteria bacterium]|nr:AAA family ATPase [Deltaproteobacteria bacterium]
MQERSEPVLLQRAFVGRERELVQLRQGLTDAHAGAGRLFLISGEPGIGKTRLAEELSIEARGRGTRVIWGRCWAGDGAPAYWPWIQVVRSCLGEADGTRVDNLLKSGAAQVTDLLPEMNQLRRSPAVAPRLDAVPSADPEEARFRLFDAVARQLKSIADAEPLMIMIDDLQQADQPSLLMLRFVARQLKEARVLIVGSYREAEVRNSPALSRLIGEIAGDGHQVLLSGLKDSEIASWLQLRGGEDVSPTVISALIGATGGNPLFIDGMLRMLAAEGQELSNGQLMIRELRLPENVRQTIRHRLSLLSKQANEILSIAAVIGQEFEFECLRTVAGSSTVVIMEALNQARRDNLINLVLAGGVSYRFAHDLIRETIYDGLPAVARASLHLKIGQTFEAIHQSNLEPHLAELAHHYRESVIVGDPAKAIDYSIRAGEAAQAVFAYEQASTQWRTALALMESHEAENARRADLLRKIGVLIFYTSDYLEGIKYLEASLKLCTTVGNPHMTALAHAELGFARGTGSNFGLHISVPKALMHFRESEALLANEEKPLTLAKVYLGSARTALEALDPEQGLSAARHGMSLAERLQ